MAPVATARPFDPSPGFGNEPYRLAVDPNQNLVFVVTMGNPRDCG